MRIDHKTQKIIDALNEAIEKFADTKLRPKPTISEPQPGLPPAPPPDPEPDKFDRLRDWLNTLSDNQELLAYSALLQAWLNYHRISWPRTVFTTDLSLRGRGRPSHNLGHRAARLRTP